MSDSFSPNTRTAPFSRRSVTICLSSTAVREALPPSSVTRSNAWSDLNLNSTHAGSGCMGVRRSSEERVRGSCETEGRQDTRQILV
eukprot:scaffold14757_cov40-Phaeocystis_antarctica.AAC.1